VARNAIKRVLSVFVTTTNVALRVPCSVRTHIAMAYNDGVDDDVVGENLDYESSYFDASAVGTLPPAPTILKWARQSPERFAVDDVGRVYVFLGGERAYEWLVGDRERVAVYAVMTRHGRPTVQRSVTTGRLAVVSGARAVDGGGDDDGGGGGGDHWAGDVDVDDPGAAVPEAGDVVVLHAERRVDDASARALTPLQTVEQPLVVDSVWYGPSDRNWHQRRAVAVVLERIRR
jgi:hypothetical protein